jgi:hypothetical protein
VLAHAHQGAGYTGLARGGRERPLNEAQRPSFRGVRVALSTGYDCVRGIRRASGNGRVRSSLTQTPIRPIRASKQITLYGG